MLWYVAPMELESANYRALGKKMILLILIINLKIRIKYRNPPPNPLQRGKNPLKKEGLEFYLVA